MFTCHLAQRPGSSFNYASPSRTYVKARTHSASLSNRPILPGLLLAVIRVVIRSRDGLVLFDRLSRSNPLDSFRVHTFLSFYFPSFFSTSNLCPSNRFIVPVARVLCSINWKFYPVLLYPNFINFNIGNNNNNSTSIQFFRKHHLDPSPLQLE